MREMLLGVIAVGVLAGLVLGRHTERVRRNYKDYGTAKTTLGKYKDLYTGAVKAATPRIIVWAAILFFAIYIITKLPPSS